MTSPAMNYIVRAIRADDLDNLISLAALTGGGMTNLPHDREALTRRLEWSLASFAKPLSEPEDELYILVLEERETKRVLGTSAIFSKIGAQWPFYNYKLATMTHTARDLNRTVKSTILNLVTDLSGTSEVGGLFLHPKARLSGVGALLARARYLFIAMHRARFADRVSAEIRGSLTPLGESPFWEAIGLKFFEMSFKDADHYNSLHGNQFISDLMPKYPIYVSLLPPDARAVIARPHDQSAPAKAMLEREGFVYDGYIDIFDGGPAFCVPTHKIATIEASRSATFSGIISPGAPRERGLLAAGTLGDFRAWVGDVQLSGGAKLPAEDAVGIATGSPLYIAPHIIDRH